MDVSTESDQKRDACQAHGKDFKIETCLAALQTKITGWVIVWKKDTKEKLGTKRIGVVINENKLMSNNLSRNVS